MKTTTDHTTSHVIRAGLRHDAIDNDRPCACGKMHVARDARRDSEADAIAAMNADADRSGRSIEAIRALVDEHALRSRQDANRGRVHPTRRVLDLEAALVEQMERDAKARHGQPAPTTGETE